MKGIFTLQNDETKIAGSSKIGRLVTAIFFKVLLLVMLFAFNTNMLVAQNCTVNAGVFQEFCQFDEIKLFGLVSGKEDVSVNRNWTQISGPTVQILNPTTFSPTIIGAQENSTYSFRLTARCTDGSLVFD